MASFTLDWYQLIVALGAAQGGLLSVALLAQHRNRTANRLLAALMVSFSLFLATSVYHASGLFRAYPQFFGVGYQMPFVFGSLTYLYAVAASDRSWRFRAPALLHVAPIVATVLITLPYYLMSGPEKIALYDRIVAGDTPARMRWIDPLKYVIGIGYSIATVRYLRAHRRRIRDSYSNTAQVNLAWLLWLAGAAAAIWLAATTIAIADANHRLPTDYITLAVAVLVYAIGYKGLRQPEVFRYETAEFAIPAALGASATAVPVAASFATPVPGPSASPTPDLPARVERPVLSAAEAEELRATLLAVMDREQPWKDSELTLADLAARADTTPHRLSALLNTTLGQTFYDFVNGYRVREVQRRIAAGDARTRKMLALALDAGFASKSTFNQVFKDTTGHTPSAYERSLSP